MKIVVPHDLHLVATGQEHAAGDVIDVPDEVGENLLEQGWRAPKAPAKKAAAPAAKSTPAIPPVADPAEPKE